MVIPPIGGSDVDYLSDLSSKDKPWDIHKNQSRQVSHSYDEGGYEGYSKRMWDCAQSLEFALCPDELGVVKFKLLGARFCRLRFCPTCQWRRSMMWRSRFLKALPRVLEDYPKARFIFVTLTVKNCALEDLRSQLAVMNKAWHSLTKKKDFPGVGWVRSVEVTRGKDGSAHPHFHCLLVVKPSYFKNDYWSHSTWVANWKANLKIDYDPILNVKVVKDLKVGSEVPVLGHEVPGVHHSIILGVLETLKYSVKPSDLLADTEWLIELTKQMHKARSVSLGGILKEYLKEEDPEDLIHADDEEEAIPEESLRLIFDWREVVNRYARQADR